METRKIYFVDIVYYNCYTFYRRYEKDLNEFSGQALTSVCLSLNLVTFFILLQEVFEITFFENKWNTLFLSVPILLIVILRYSKYMKIDKIEEIMYSYDLNKRRRLSIMASIYILISIFGTIVFFIILGELNNS